MSDEDNVTENINSINYKCNVCNKSFESESILRKHACQSEGKKDLQCHRCQKTFKRSQGLSSHKKICNPEHNFCKKCNIKFDHRFKYYRHLFSHKDKVYTCEFCEKKFFNIRNYTRHKYLHKGKSKVCNLCNRKFHFSENLLAHFKIHHSKEKPFKCEVCLASFREKWLLKKHMNKHTKEISYLCEICGKLFYDPASYRSHLRTHTRDYVCLLCNKKYNHYGSFRVHKKTHFQDKPNKSKKQSEKKRKHKQDKGKKYNQKKDTKRLFQPPSLLFLAIKAKLNRSSSNKTYKCEICSANFYSSRLLESHKKNHGHYIIIDLEEQDSQDESHKCKKRNETQKKENKLEQEKITRNLFQPPSLLSLAMKTQMNGSAAYGIHLLHTAKTFSASTSFSQSQEESKKLCETSDSSLLFSSSMNAHLNIFSNIMYKCEICPANFESSSLLESHKMTHKHYNTVGHETQKCVMRKPPISIKKQLNTNTLEIRRLQYEQFQKHCRSFINTSKYGCGLCEEAFSSVTDLNLHLPSHKDESISLCMICEASFSFTYELIEHCYKILNDKHYLCKMCMEKFENSHNLVKHLQEKHAHACDDSKNPIFKEHDCSIKPSTLCRNTFNGMASVNRHFTTYQGIHLKTIQISPVGQQQRFQCEHCSKTFILACELVKHKSCCCDLCNETFDCEIDFLYHRVLHNRPSNVSLVAKSINCDKCHKNFIDNDKFKLHDCSGITLSSNSKSHFNSENILDANAKQQDSCSEIFNESGNFNNISKNCNQMVDPHPDNNTKELNLSSLRNDSNRHLDSETDLIEDGCLTIEENSYCCDFGKKSSHQGSTLDSKVNDRKCDTISVQKLQFAQFQKHLKSYENNTNFDCGLCKKSFCSKVDLSEHLPSHNDENIAFCIICEASFSCTLELIEHCLNILNNEHYFCKYCRKFFESQDELDKHLKTKHLHFCRYCNKSYLKKDGLKTHIRKKHCNKEQNLLMCVKCLKTFLLFSELKKHKSSSCEVCSETFDCESLLLKHKVLHKKPPDASQQVSKNHSNVENFPETYTNQQGSTSNSLDSFMNINNSSNKVLLPDVSKLNNSLLGLNHGYNSNDTESVLKLINGESSDEKNIEKSSNESIFMDFDSIFDMNIFEQDSIQSLGSSKILNELPYNHNSLSVSKLDNNSKEFNHINPIDSLKNLFSTYNIHETNYTNQQDSVSLSLDNSSKLSDESDFCSIISVTSLAKNAKRFNHSNSNSIKKFFVSNGTHENKINQSSSFNNLDSSISLNIISNCNEGSVFPESNKQIYPNNNSNKILDSEPILVDLESSIMELVVPKSNKQIYPNNNLNKTLDSEPMLVDLECSNMELLVPESNKQIYPNNNSNKILESEPILVDLESSNMELVVPDNNKQICLSNNSNKILESEPIFIDLDSSNMEQNLQYYVPDKTSCFPSVSFDTKLNDKNEFLCVICDKFYVNKWSFKQHMLKEHTVKQTYTCDYCKKNFSYISVFKNHLASHKLN